MHALIRKGLLLSAATGTLVVGWAGAASAASDAAVARGAAADSPGAVSGNVAQVPADIPIQVCGDAGTAGAAQTDSRDNSCWTDDTTAVADGAAADSPGAVSGNVVQVPVNAPVQACGDALSLLGYGTSAEDNHCVNGGPEMAPVPGPPPVPCPPVSCPPPVPCPPPPPGPCPPDSEGWTSQAA